MGATLVVGATGQVGGQVARQLLDAGQDVRILVRDGSDASALTELGATPVPGDLKDPSSLKAVLEDVDRVVTTANSATRAAPDTTETVDRDGNIALVDAATAAGVDRFVLVSAQGAHPTSPVPFMAAKGAAEQHLRGSGLAWTILSCDVFMDVWVPMWVLEPLRAGQPVRLVGDAPRRHYFVASADVAGFAVASLDADEARGATLVVGGPEALSWPDIVEGVEHVSGRPVETARIPADRPVEGLPDMLSGLLIAMETYDSPPPIDPAAARTSYGVELTSLEAFLRASAN